MDNLIKKYMCAYDGLLLFFSIVLLIIIMTLNAYLNQPEKLIEEYLVKQNYQQSNVTLQQIGSNEYLLLNPPQDKITNFPLARWKIESLGKFVYYATPIDIPPTKTIQMNLELTQEDYEILKQQADKLDMSVEDFLQSNIMHLIK